ncbi:MAG: hypothetical protein V4456_00525 [Bacteroidota bacterium]
MKKKFKGNPKATSFVELVDSLAPVGDYNYDLKEAYHLDKGKISDAEMESINAKLKDIEEGKVLTQEEAKIRIEKN